MMDNKVPIFCLNAIISMFYFYTGILYERKKRLSGFNATGHLILRIQPFLSIVNTDFDKNVKCEMFFYTLIHIQQRIVLLTNIRT